MSLKKTLAIILAISALGGLSACDSKEKESSDEETTIEETVIQETAIETEELAETTIEKSEELNKEITFNNISYCVRQNWNVQDKDEYDIIILSDGSGISVIHLADEDGVSDSDVLYLVESLIEKGDLNENYDFGKIDGQNAVIAYGKENNSTEYYFTNGSEIYTISFMGDKDSHALKYKDNFLNNIKISSKSAEYQNEVSKADSEQNQSKTEVPKEYTNALTKAKSYSENMHMSKAAIHDQLTSEYGEGFSEEAADYAMENLNADYKENALYKAKSYQDNMAMSPSAIYDQLISEYGEQFTEEEAQYAIDNLN